MAQSTRATRALEQARVSFSLHAYDYDPSAESIGQAAAVAIGADPAQVFKTLMLLADGKPACVVAPSSGEVSMKKAAAALRAKSAAMMKPADAERLTGYKIGGISPFGQMRRVPTVIDETALLWDAIFLNGGQRGLQARLSGDDAAALLGATFADIAA
ncbi:Cys-tRNA(Pro) deacylase [Novosphingobium sp. ST904]|uniref:Cys-tRNA(Pro) deacylase n=1 Tax=Novosphingobium sp. ST904 TaxID=1684385 RepID=UPI0006C8A5C3|nr:Cys-tRNA(Pro) deacylase [Novosphingobium sp. ST904]KPH58109.1 prolyl-tRNA synthetase [Novosphingobium sp. ST904]TCM41439.1 Cys-tRNA(Pro)/Cys-tRNA(Cys) deacylase [Novosphingobium sp. ST904]